MSAPVKSAGVSGREAEDFGSLHDVALYESLRSTIEPIEGFLHPLEGFALYLSARHGGGRGVIVEIGSFMGRSTAWLAAGSRDGNRETVFAVDHFRGSLEHRQGGSHANHAIAQTGTTFPQFRSNVERLGFGNRVVAFVGDSVAVSRQWDKAVRLLFIDGDHSYEASRRDCEAWNEFLTPGGLLIFHDVGGWPGVTRFYEEFCRSNPAWRQICTIGSLRIVRKD
jgi:MMP 1-O-methyltransferase